MRMESTKQGWQLHQAPLGLKLCISLMIVTLSAGLLASQFLVSQSLHGGNHWDWPSVEQLRLKYAASPLERALLSHMAQYLDKPAEADVVVAWCRAGGERHGYYERAAPVLNRRCLRCHGGESTRGDVVLSTWGDLAPLALKRGPAQADLLRSTHLHLFAISMLLLLAGVLLWPSRWPRWLRLGLPMLTFVALRADIGGWWLARHFESAIYLVMSGGLLLTMGMTACLGLALFDMWRPTPKSSV